MGYLCISLVGTLAREAEWKYQEAQNDAVKWRVDDGYVRRAGLVFP
jgi:hypothetical protein